MQELEFDQRIILTLAPQIYVPKNCNRVSLEEDLRRAILGSQAIPALLEGEISPSECLDILAWAGGENPDFYLDTLENNLSWMLGGR